MSKEIKVALIGGAVTFITCLLGIVIPRILPEEINLFSSNDKQVIVDNNVTETKNEKTCKNSFINISEGGYTIFVDDYVYYSNPKDSYKIYRMDKKFENQEKICDISGVGLNYYDGWIYFVGASGTSQYLYRMDKNGKYQILNKNRTYGPKIYESYIYYRDLDKGGLYRYNLSNINDSSDGGVLTGDCISKHSVDYVVIYKDSVYYIDNSDSRCYTVSFSGENEHVFIDKCLNELAIQDNILYYSVQNIDQETNNENIDQETNNGGIYQKDLDDDTERKLSDANVHSMNVSGDYIYFSNLDEDGKLYRMTISEAHDGIYPVLNFPVRKINIMGNLITYKKDVKESDEKGGGDYYWFLTNATESFEPIPVGPASN